MITLYKSFLFSVALGLACPLQSQASVVMLAEDDGEGGFTLTASGFLDFSEFTFNRNSFNSFADIQVGSTIRTLLTNQPTSFFNTPGAELNPTIGSPVTNLTDVTSGTFGNTFTLGSGFLRANGYRFDAEQTPGVVNYDFVMFDDFHRGSIDEFVDGHVLWDSNGFGTPGGQTISFRVVPEPSTALLGGLASLTLLRRKRG